MHVRAAAWPVCYHATGKLNGRSIAQDGYDLAKTNNATKGAGVVGFYSTPNPDVAAKYAHPFTDESGKKWVIMFQNRVRPDTLNKASTSSCSAGEFWISAAQADVRPYGICVKRVG
jgi:hypothetical protein